MKPGRVDRRSARGNVDDVHVVIARPAGEDRESAVLASDRSVPSEHVRITLGELRRSRLGGIHVRDSIHSPVANGCVFSIDQPIIANPVEGCHESTGRDIRNTLPGRAGVARGEGGETENIVLVLDLGRERRPVRAPADRCHRELISYAEAIWIERMTPAGLQVVDPEHPGFGVRQRGAVRVPGWLLTGLRSVDHCAQGAGLGIEPVERPVRDERCLARMARAPVESGYGAVIGRDLIDGGARRQRDICRCEGWISAATNSVSPPTVRRNPTRLPSAFAAGPVKVARSSASATEKSST